MQIKPLTINQYALAFAFITLLLFSLFTLFSYLELNKLKNDIQANSRIAAAHELEAALHKAIQHINNYTRDFAGWEEVKQQVSNPSFYAYWQNYRSHQSGLLPANISAVQLYDAEGKILAPLESATLPRQLDPSRKDAWVATRNGSVDVITQASVRLDDADTTPFGHVAVQSPLIYWITRLNRFNHLDEASLEIDPAGIAGLPVTALLDKFRYSLRSDAVADTLREAMTSAVIRLALIIAALTIVSYPMLAYFMGKPLVEISHYIDRLKAHSTHEKLPPFERRLAIQELEKIRHSLNAYHSDLMDAQTDLDLKNQKLWDQANHDPLTGAMNRRAFDSYWEEIGHVFADQRIDLSMILFDVDHFKAINDTYGHQAGDSVLKNIANIIESMLRKGDRLFRLGGDEFATILLNCDAKGALNLAERCSQMVAEHPFSELGIKEPVRISIGIAQADEDNANLIEKLHWQADVAMYKAKRPGHQQIAIFDKSMEADTQGIFISWINDAVFQAVIHGTGIRMYYQPVVNLDDRRIEYYESLVRIHHNDDVIMPSNIFPLVESRRLDVELDYVVIRQVLADVESGKIPDGCGVSINLSATGIISRRLFHLLMSNSNLLKKHPLILEITETALITQIRQATTHIIRLREAGYQVALDDFGSGYSSLQYLATMPVDIVKFDQALIRSLNDETHETIIQHMADMIIETGHKLVAEGVETDDIADKARALGFHNAQGWLFGKPHEIPQIPKEKIAV
jgi:diguanylate cyclase (GGDEF)-like protein